MMRWIGIICIIGACSACGFSMAGSYLFMERCLRQLKNALEVMLCQMEYRMTALTELCGIVASACGGPIGQVFRDLGQELQTGDAPNASACMAYALAKNNQLPESCQGILKQIGSNLGQLDLESPGGLHDRCTLREDFPSDKAIRPPGQSRRNPLCDKGELNP